MRTSTTRKKARDEYWGEQLAAQENSGLTVRRFSQRQGLREHAFYAWRKRLRRQTPGLRFARAWLSGIDLVKAQRRKRYRRVA